MLVFLVLDVINSYANARGYLTYNTLTMKNKNLLDKFEASLVVQDLASRTVNGYLQDIDYYLKWLLDFYQQDISLLDAKLNDIQAFREYLSKRLRQRPSSINRRLQSVKHFYAWALQIGIISEDHAKNIHFARRSAPTKPQALTKKEVHALLTSAGRSSHNLEVRNYALIQLLVQTGMRVGEVAALRIGDITIYERTGSVRIVDGKGNKQREIPLNSTVRRALKAYLQQRLSNGANESNPVFISKRGTPVPIRSLQKVVESVADRAHIDRIKVGCHTLRHTFATQYLQANPGQLVELAMLLGHDSINTTAIYTKASKEKLAQAVENSEINLYGNS